MHGAGLAHGPVGSWLNLLSSWRAPRPRVVRENSVSMSGPYDQAKRRTRRPILAITMGDAAGIGPEIVVRALATQEIPRICRPLVIGDAGVIRATVVGLRADVHVHRVLNVEEARFGPDTIDVLDLENIQLGQLKKAQVDPMAGRAAVENVLKAIELATTGRVDAIVTAPLHKQAMQQAGFSYPGHTELLAEKTGSSSYAMMFVAGDFRVVLVTIHCSLRGALDAISQDSVLEKIRLAHQALQRLGIGQPRIAVAGINPHAGEGGMFGREEIEILEPAIWKAQTQGICASGPYPSDTLFARALQGRFDVVVSMYHDQGLIPVKLVGFEKGVNVTLGLPIIRTSVDHGTAFGRAWQWRADAGSMIAAIDLASRMANTPNADNSSER